MRASLIVALAMLGAAAAGGTDAPRAAAAGPITLEQVAAGFASPVGIASAGDSRLFVVEQGGRVRIVDGATVLPAPFLDVSGLVSVSSERGLLGLAFHPNYPASPYFYVDYTDTGGDVVVARYRVSANPDVADPSSALILKTIGHPDNANHNGGQLAFGPDGKLYAGVGDGGGAGDVPNNAQSLATLLGKILRLDVDAAAPYIPAGNPFTGTPGALGEIWAYGLRNPWRFSFDRVTGDLIIGDVGQGNWEEVDVQPAASAGGENYGWRLMEGDHCYNPPTGCDPGGLTPPVLEYSHAAGDCAIIGGPRYRGQAISLAGTYLYGDFCTGRIWGAAEGPGGWSSSLLLDTPYLISSFGEDQNGAVYLTDLAAGAIYRIVPAGPAVGGVAEAPAPASSPRAGPERGAWPAATAVIVVALAIAAVGARLARRNR